MARRRGRAVVGVVMGGILLGGCTGSAGSDGQATGRAPTAAPLVEPPAASSVPSRAAPTGEAESARSAASSGTAGPAVASEFDARAALRDIVRLADGIGPREATSKAFREAAGLVEQRFEDLGFEVHTQRVEVPAGISWGTPVRSGTSRNVVAEPARFDPTDPHVVLVAHLDTIPVAPGAEDNASGVAVLMELARLASAEPPSVPVRFIAFGAEEPRGSGDARHHFGSRQHVAGLTDPQRAAIRGVIALDRVGVRSRSVPVCSARGTGNALRAELRDAAQGIDVPTHDCSRNTTSDHWSYVKVGIPAVRLGSVPYAGYHSALDTPDVIDRRQLDRVGRTVWAWLQGLDAA